MLLKEIVLHSNMNEQELCKKRLLDLSNQADLKGIVTFSDFLNLNELNIYHTIKNTFYSNTLVFGGYDNAERQMVAFIPDALSYKWVFPIKCIHIVPKYPKYAEKLTHRDILGALMNLGIERNRLGDILCLESDYYVFCDEKIYPFIINELNQIRHTIVNLSEEADYMHLQANIQLEEQYDMIASNRIDCIIAKACHLSRSEASNMLAAEKVFINGRCVTNCNHSCESGSIISVRGKTRFVFEDCNTISKKGKLRVKFSFYK